jgi:hypothetical protein
MSMMTSAVLVQSSSIGSGSAAIFPIEFVMTYAPPDERTFEGGQARRVPLCTTPFGRAAKRNRLCFQIVECLKKGCLLSERSFRDGHLLIRWAYFLLHSI